MFVMTMTKRKLLRVIMFILVLLTGIAIGIFAILSSVETKAEGIKVPIYCVDRADNKISITFDCAWGNSNTDELIEILDKNKVKATFFVTGEFCDKYPDDVRKLSKAGHEIANHSDTHPHLKGINVNALIDDTKECNRKIKMLTGEDCRLYRAPYGEYDDKAVTTLEGMGMKVIQWSCDSIDWNKVPADVIVDRMTKNIASGAILLFHNDLENTTEALPKVLSGLAEQGYEMTTVSELIYKENYIIDAEGKQKLNIKDTAVYFSENRALNSAFNSLADNLTTAQIEKLASSGMSEELAEFTRGFLTEEEIAAIRTQSYDELYSLFTKLRTAVYNKEVSQNNSSPVITESSQETSSAETTIVTDKDGMENAVPMESTPSKDNTQNTLPVK